MHIRPRSKNHATIPRHIGSTFPTIEALADYRVTVLAPQMGGVCPAAEYTFDASDDDGQTFRNPSDQEREELKQAVRNHTECCLNRSEECPWRD